MKDSRSAKPSYQLLIIDIIVFAILGAIEGLLGLRSVGLEKSESLLIGFAIPLFLFILVGLILYVLAEYKFNRLKLKNIFLYLSIAIVVCNIIAVASLPNKVIMPNGAEMLISPSMRTYYLLSGSAFGLVPYICFYLIPRKVLHHRYMHVILYIILGISVLLIILSPMVEWKSYGMIFASHFEDAEQYALQSICGQKNIFALFILYGVFATILLRIYQKKPWWLLFNILFFPFLILTFSKMTILIAAIALIGYFVIRLIQICKKSRDNLIIALLICGFCLLLLPLFINGIVKSESGILLNIKNLFVKFAESAKRTFETRMVIWRSSFELLAPYQYIFGFGINTFGVALHYAYTLETNIYSAHNMAVELIGRGGVIMLGIYLFLYVYLIYVALKLRKKTPWLSFASIFFIFMTIAIGMVESLFICGYDWGILISVVTLLPVMSEYYIQLNKNEVEVRKEIVKQSKSIGKVKFKSKLLELNKKRIMFDAKCIAYDLSSKIIV